jgi:hypothetical protein
VIPALDVFKNIRECLGATSVTLPTALDLVHTDSQTTRDLNYTNMGLKECSQSTPCGLLSPPASVLASLNTNRDCHPLRSEHLSTGRETTPRHAQNTLPRYWFEETYLQFLSRYINPDDDVAIMRTFWDQYEDSMPLDALRFDERLYHHSLDAGLSGQFGEKSMPWACSRKGDSIQQILAAGSDPRQLQHFLEGHVQHCANLQITDDCSPRHEDDGSTQCHWLLM